jgi:hypothetical protein
MDSHAEMAVPKHALGREDHDLFWGSSRFLSGRLDEGLECYRAFPRPGTARSLRYFWLRKGPR